MSGLPKGFWKQLKCRECDEHSDGDTIYDGTDLVPGIICHDCGPKECDSFWWNTNKRATIRRLCPDCYWERVAKATEWWNGLVNHAAMEKL